MMEGWVVAKGKETGGEAMMVIQICGSDGHHLVLEATNLRMCSARTHSGSQNVEMVGALMLLMMAAHVSFAYHCSCRVAYPINPIQ
jgi:hypothetical protein